MAVLLSEILGTDACVGDVNEESKNDDLSIGLTFQVVDLTSDEKLPSDSFYLVILQEVIEHLPHPPYIVFKRIMKFLKPSGVLFLTTPNGLRASRGSADVRSPAGLWKPPTPKIRRRFSHPNCMIAPGGRTMIEQWSRDRVSQLTQALAYWIAQDAAC